MNPAPPAGRDPGRSDHVPRDVLCVVLCVVLCMVLCVVLIIKLLPTQSILSRTSAVIGVLDQWMSLRLQMGTGKLFHCYLASW